jgi:hypothetical protein
MARYVSKPEHVEAITFEELVEIGRSSGTPLHGKNGMPWSFEYKGKPVTHESDACYLVPGESGETMRFTPQHMLMNDEQGNLFTCGLDIFNQVYEEVKDG